MIGVDYIDPNFVLSFKYDQALIDVVRNLPVRAWKKDKKVWTVPKLAIKTLEPIEKHLLWTQRAIDKKVAINKALLELVDLKFSSGEKHSKLFPYQTIGVSFLKKAKKALLADDMGLGKSIQTIQAILDLNLQSVLFLCPATLKLNWRNEFIKHYGIEPIVVSGDTKTRVKLWNSKEPYIVANYDVLQRDWQHIPKSFNAIVADEAVYLKHHSANRTKFAKKLQSDYRFGLSGLPIENNLMEFHSIMEWIRPEILPNYNRFKYRYCVFDYTGKIIGYKNLEELHLLTSPFILRRTINEVLPELPEKIYSEVPLEFVSKTEQLHYEAIAKDYIEWLHQQTGNNWQMGALEKTIRLRQFVEFPEILGFNFEGAKLTWLKEIREDLNKFVVFSFFKDSVNLLVKELGAKYTLTGDTPNSDRVALIERFNNEDKAILVCTDAGRFGVNITGSNTLIQYGIVHNPAVMRQREGRLHRIGQKSVVNVIEPYIINTIDEGIRKIFLNRENQAFSFMEGNFNMSVARLSKKDFERMVRGE